MFQELNLVLSFKHTRLVLVLLFSILAGNIARPLPKMLDSLYQDTSMQSQLFKFVMLFVLALLTNGPVKDMNHLLFIAGSCLVVLIIFHLLREFEKKH